jgi:hypothetical protein
LAQSGFRALRQWRDLHAGGSDEGYKRQLAAADAARVHTQVANALGVAAQLQLDFGDRVCARRWPPVVSQPCCILSSYLQHAHAPRNGCSKHGRVAR